jgi:hypothetical protein
MFEVQHASPRLGSIIHTTKEDMAKGTYAKQVNMLVVQRSDVYRHKSSVGDFLLFRSFRARCTKRRRTISTANACWIAPR